MSPEMGTVRTARTGFGDSPRRTLGQSPRTRPDLLKAQVLLIIKELGPVTADTIADTVPVLSTDPARTIRRKVRDLIMTDRIPIASSMQPPFGYFIVEPGSGEAEAYVLQLRGRLEKIAQRLARFRKSSAARIQGVLFEEFGPSVQSSIVNRQSSIPNEEAKCQE